MTGSVQEKNGYLYAVLNFKDMCGSRRQKWINLNLPVRGNRRRAEEMLGDLLIEYQGLELVEPHDALLSTQMPHGLSRTV